MTRPLGKVLALCAIALLFVYHDAARGGAIGPAIPKGSFELGLQYRGVHRQITSGATIRDLEGSDGSLFFKYGLTHLATLAGEALVLPDIEYRFGEDGGGSWRFYALGAGLQVTIWERREWTVQPGFYATRTLWFAEQDGQCDEKWQTLDWVLLGFYATSWKNAEIVLWGGPGYFYVERVVLQGPGCLKTYWDTEDNWGGTAGLNVLLYDHVHGCFNFVYADEFEPRIGLSYRF